MLEIRPITFKGASKYINTNHRHHKATVGCKFCISVWNNEKLCGVAVCGRPVSRYFDNGEICEINRLCTDGTKNACSKLYAACAKIAKDMGYKKIITYILESESGTSLKASGFNYDGIAGGTHWTGSRNRQQNLPKEMKKRYIKNLIKTSEIHKKP